MSKVYEIPVLSTVFDHPSRYAKLVKLKGRSDLCIVYYFEW